MLWRRRLREEGVDAPSLLFHSIFSRAAKKRSRVERGDSNIFDKKAKQPVGLLHSGTLVWEHKEQKAC